MSVITELARKQAGISDMSKGHPKNPKQRGCHFWGQYSAAVGVLTDQHADEMAKLSSVCRRQGDKINSLTEQISKLRMKLVEHGIGDIVRDLPSIDTDDRNRLISVARNAG